ncbi:beta clamp domain-containing protein [Halosimplex halophilum]|uniref:DNA polymerase sliding clamp n=1 Tax=Halosimplex halophilum TaxID=2559572 RepID=UPI00107F0181|nr:DNA polymerase sliding clamp [Halosimplex halophilum]
MTPEQRQDDGTESTANRRTDPADRTLDVRVGGDRLATAVDAAAAVADECRVRFEDGLAFRARDPADVAMAELRLDRGAFDAYEADEATFGVALDRLGDAVSLADGESVRLALGEGGRFDVSAGAVEYAFAPIAAEAVREVQWVDAGPTASSATMAAEDLRRAVRAADLVADHATFAVDPDERTLTVAASGDTDDVRLDFDDEALDALDAGAVESLYSVDYLRDIVGAIPDGVAVTVEFVGGDEGGCPLSLEHPFAGGAGTGRWLLAPRIRR